MIRNDGKKKHDPAAMKLLQAARNAMEEYMLQVERPLNKRQRDLNYRWLKGREIEQTIARLLQEEIDGWIGID